MSDPMVVVLKPHCLKGDHDIRMTAWSKKAVVLDDYPIMLVSAQRCGRREEDRVTGLVSGKHVSNDLLRRFQLNYYACDIFLSLFFDSCQLFLCSLECIPGTW